MVNFELGKDVEKYVFFFVMSRAWDAKKHLSLYLYRAQTSI